MQTANPVTLSKHSKAIRIYAWAWQADPNNIDVCKLFWGFLFLPVALIAHGFSLLAAGLSAILPKRKSKTYTFDLEAEEAKYAKRIERLDKWNDRFMRFSMWLSGLKRTKAVLKALAWFAVGIYFGFLLVLLVLAILEAPLVCLAVFAGGGLMAGIIFLIVQLSPSLRNAGRATKSAAKAVKNRTCPEIIVK